MEELRNCSIHGRDRSIAPSFFDTKALFIHIIYRNWFGTHTFEPAILKSPCEATAKKHHALDLEDFHANAMLLRALYGLAGSLLAADPPIGTWKPNIAKSKLPLELLTVKELSFVVCHAALQILCKAVSPGAISGRYRSIKHSWKLNDSLSQVAVDIENILEDLREMIRA